MKLKFYTKFSCKILSFNLSVIILGLFPVTFYLINPSNEFFNNWFYFLHSLFFNLIHIIFRQNNRLWNSFSISFLIFYFLSFKSLLFNSTKSFSISKRLFLTFKSWLFCVFYYLFSLNIFILIVKFFWDILETKNIIFKEFYSNF